MTDTAPPRSGLAADTAAARPPREDARFRPATRRWNRIALGIALIAVAVGGNVVLYAGLNRSEPVVQVVQDVPAGEQLTADMLRTVDVDVDDSVNVIAGDRLDAIVGTYARVRLVSGSLVTEQALQSGPLVAEGSSIVAIQVADGSLPTGLRERVPVELVIPPVPANVSDGADPAALVIPGRVIGLPTETSNALGTLSMSVEVGAGDAATVAAADDVRVVLLSPSADPAAQPASGPSDDEDGGG